MFDESDIEVTVMTELIEVGHVIASVDIPQGDYGPIAWPKMLERLSEHLDLVERAIDAAHKSLKYHQIKVSRGPDMISVYDETTRLSRSFKVDPPQITKTLIIRAFHPEIYGSIQNKS